MFLKKSSDIHGLLVKNEDFYDTGSAVVGLYRLFTDLLFEFPGELGGSLSGGGGGGLSLRSQDVPPQILYFSHFF